ncbi:hypothetical protein SBA7_610061 [Candidatus Sulfotelmatobacter sp. SbA7]|nr:hypothetical protein SBA7_610061 [Candidatus Sulfotelmatobacter sp. SbA7]
MVRSNNQGETIVTSHCDRDHNQEGLLPGRLLTEAARRGLRHQRDLTALIETASLAGKAANDLEVMYDGKASSGRRQHVPEDGKQTGPDRRRFQCGRSP